jgi:starvation-inducible DNA-binding protein
VLAYKVNGIEKFIRMSKELNSIGLAEKDSADLANSLNDLLANYQVFYMNTRGFHWNIKGDKFFELHLKFEELYTDAQLKIDEIAERILTLGYTPIHAYADYLEVSSIKPHKNVSDGYQAVKYILESFKILITKQRALLKLSADADDEGTNAQMSDYIRAQEKLVWMYSAFLGKENQ